MGRRAITGKTNDSGDVPELEQLKVALESNGQLEPYPDWYVFLLAAEELHCRPWEMPGLRHTADLECWELWALWKRAAENHAKAAHARMAAAAAKMRR